MLVKASDWVPTSPLAHHQLLQRSITCYPSLYFSLLDQYFIRCRCSLSACCTIIQLFWSWWFDVACEYNENKVLVASEPSWDFSALIPVPHQRSPLRPRVLSSVKLPSSDRAMFQVGIEIAKEPITSPSEDFGMEAKGMLANFLHHIIKSSFVDHPPRWWSFTLWNDKNKEK